MLYNPIMENGKMLTNGMDGGLNEEGMVALVDVALSGDTEALNDAIEGKGQELVKAMEDSHGMIASTVRVIQQEYQAMLEIRVTLLQAQAIETLSEVMQGRHIEGAAPMVSAANSLLSRGMFPNRTRTENLSFKVETSQKLPALADVISAANTEEERLALADQMTQIVTQIDALKSGSNGDDKET